MLELIVSKKADTYEELSEMTETNEPLNTCVDV